MVLRTIIATRYCAPTTVHTLCSVGGLRACIYIKLHWSAMTGVYLLALCRGILPPYLADYAAFIPARASNSRALLPNLAHYVGLRG